MGYPLPDSEQVRELLEALLDGCPDLTSSSDVPDAGWMDKAYACICRNDDGESTVGLVADLHAALFLGGKLMMMPDAGLEDQADEGELWEEPLDALSEVFNNLTVTLNATPAATHVVSRPAARPGSLDGDEAEWMKSCSNCLSLEAKFPTGQGKLVILAN